MTSDTNRKYAKKLEKARRQLLELDSSASEVAAELQSKIKKYEKKLSATTAEPSNVPTSSEPAASLVKDTSGITLLLFYAYIEPPWSPAQHSAALQWAENTLSELHITGRLRIAREGFNGTLTGSYSAMRSFTSQLRAYDSHLSNMNDKDDFKYKDNLPEGQKFPKLKVFAVKELVNYGLGVETAPSVTQGGVHLDPVDYHKKLQEPNTVVIDVRNSYEAEIGRFNPTNGATYIDPKFPIWARENIDKYRDKQVLMYCTGGIRCERASALFRSLGHDKVYQLKGGIHNYLEEFGKKGDGLWIGDNYTFDKRFAHGVEGPPANTATTPAASEENAEQSSSSTPNLTADIPKVIGKCAGCSIPWSKYRGKRRCPTCGVPLLLCTNCLKTDADKHGAKCHLCQEDEREKRKPFNKKLHYAEIMGADEEGETNNSSGGTKLGKRSKPAAAGHTCGVCNESFKSRNALFKHIKDSGHATRKAKKMKKV